jgi:DNA-binding CsgD family transcriptional regulator
MLLVMMAHAGQLADDASYRVHGSPESVKAVVVSAARPDLELARVLSPCELEVVRLRVDGLSHGRIASLRSTSERTVANQLASVFAKLGVSGRPQLLAALVTGEWKRNWRAPALSRAGAVVQGRRTTALAPP